MKTFRVIDFETTSLPPNAGVIEVGYTDLKWEGKSMSVDDWHAQLTNPMMTIDPGAKAVNHIEERDLIGKPHPDTVLPTLNIGADFIVAHNLRFEANFFKTQLPTICTLKCARALIPEASKHTNQYLRYFLDLPVERGKAEPPHRAGPDSYVTAYLLKHLLMLSVQQGGDFVNRLVKITNEAQLLTHIRFGKYAGQTFEEIAYADRRYLLWIVNNDRAEPDVKNTAQHWLNRTAPI